MKSNTAHDKLKSIVDELIEHIENGEASWIKPWGNTFPMNYSTKRHYNGINVWILWSIAMQRKYPTNYWLSFKNIQALGGTINKGEKATGVFFFKPLNIREEDENTGEITTKTIPLLKTYNVFNISQTDLKIEDIKDTQLIPDVEEFIENVGVKIVQDDSAYYSPSRHYIGMPHKDTFRSTDAYYSTILHEIAHSSGNKNLLDRDMTGKFGSPEYAQEELIAETTKVFLETHLGLAHENSEHFEQSAAYLKGWLKPLADDPKQLWKIFSQAQKAFDYLLECQEKKEIAA